MVSCKLLQILLTFDNAYTKVNKFFNKLQGVQIVKSPISNIKTLYSNFLCQKITSTLLQYGNFLFLEMSYYLPILFLPKVGQLQEIRPKCPQVLPEVYDLSVFCHCQQNHDDRKYFSRGEIRIYKDIAKTAKTFVLQNFQSQCIKQYCLKKNELFCNISPTSYLHLSFYISKQDF